MKKGTIIHVVVMVVAVIAGTMLAIKLNNDQRALIPEKAELAAIPVGGFHKFAADVEWMLFVNYMGSLSTVDESNVEDVIGRLERLIALDPNLDKLYKDGVSSIAIQDPEKSIELLKKACNLKSASATPNKTKVAKISKAKLQEIAELKMPDLNAASVESAMSMIEGTCRSMGVTVTE